MLLVADEVYSLHKSIYYSQESHSLLEHHRSSWESTPPAEGLFWLISGGRLPMSRDAAKRRFRAVPRLTSRKRVLLPRHNCISTFLANWPFFPTPPGRGHAIHPCGYSNIYTLAPFVFYILSNWNHNSQGNSRSNNENKCQAPNKPKTAFFLGFFSHH